MDLKTKGARTFTLVPQGDQGGTFTESAPHDATRTIKNAQHAKDLLATQDNSSVEARAEFNGQLASIITPGNKSAAAPENIMKV